MKKAKSQEDKALDAINAYIKAWVKTRSGPTMMTISHPDIQVRIKFRGWKKIILERTLND